MISCKLRTAKWSVCVCGERDRVNDNLFRNLEMGISSLFHLQFTLQNNNIIELLWRKLDAIIPLTGAAITKLKTRTQRENEREWERWLSAMLFESNNDNGFATNLYCYSNDHQPMTKTRRQQQHGHESVIQRDVTTRFSLASHLVTAQTFLWWSI